MCFLGPTLNSCNVINVHPANKREEEEEEREREREGERERERESGFTCLLTLHLQVLCGCLWAALTFCIRCAGYLSDDSVSKLKRKEKNGPYWQKLKWVGVVFQRMKTDTLPQFLPTRSVFAFLFKLSNQCVLFKTLLTTQWVFCCCCLWLFKKKKKKKKKRRRKRKQLCLTASKWWVLTVTGKFFSLKPIKQILMCAYVKRFQRHQHFNVRGI